jgi:hypothetical protein
VAQDRKGKTKARFFVAPSQIDFPVANLLSETVGACVVVHLRRQAGRKDEAIVHPMADLTMQMQSLNSIASDYSIANQQGYLIFMLVLQEKAINANRAAQKKNPVIGIVSSVFGNLLLLFANLIAKSGAYFCYYSPPLLFASLLLS